MRRPLLFAVALAAVSSMLQAQEGVSIRALEGVKLRIGGYVHVDGRSWWGEDSAPAPGTFLLRRVRPVIDGEAGERFTFRIMPDFGQGNTVLQEAWVELRLSGGRKLRAGKFKAPLGLERLMSANDLFFMERGLPAALVPNRDIGVQLSGNTARLDYAVAVMNGVADGGSGDVDNEDGKDVLVRVMTRPPAGPVSLSIGLAASAGTQRSPAGSQGLATLRTAGQLPFFPWPAETVARGSRTRWSPQAQCTVGGLRAIAEYVRSSQEVRRSPFGGQVADGEVTMGAWQVAAGYLLTGEKAALRTVRPNRPFDGKGGRGAVEVVARYGALRVDEGAFAFADPARAAQSLSHAGIGVNWILNANVKLALDLDRTTFRFHEGAASRPAEHALFARWQLVF